MKNLSKLTAFGAVLVLSASFASADQIDLSGPGTFSAGTYTPTLSAPSNQFDVTLDTGIFTTFYGATPVFYTFNDATVPTTPLFSVENLAATEDLTFFATTEDVLNSTQILFTGELYENGAPLSSAILGFSENPVNSSGTEDAITAGEAPEPSSLILLGTGLIGAAGVLMHKRKSVPLLRS